MNVLKTFRRRPGPLVNFLCTFNLRPLSRVSGCYSFSCVTYTCCTQYEQEVSEPECFTTCNSLRMNSFEGNTLTYSTQELFCIVTLILLNGFCEFCVKYNAMDFPVSTFFFCREVSQLEERVVALSQQKNTLFKVFWRKTLK